ncbi:TPA: TIR domain-containing protein [Vibrio vulnificus]
MDFGLLEEMIAQALSSLRTYESTGDSSQVFNKVRAVGDICIENNELHPDLKKHIDMREQYDFKVAAIKAQRLSSLTGGVGKNLYLTQQLEVMMSSCKKVLANMNNVEEVQMGKGSIIPKSEKVFIVHGHDELSKVNVARFVEQLGLKPIILHEQASGSRTIIEKIEAYSEVGFAIVIYSPCDVGAKKGTDPDLKSRARQNVVFEHGYFIGHLGRSNVCALVKGDDLETPNDISGVVYTQLDDRGAWKMDLAKELKESGYSINLTDAI